MQIFNFVVLSVIIALQNVPTTHISKTNLHIVSLNVRELELNWCSKDQSKKKRSSPSWELEAQLPPQILKIY